MHFLDDDLELVDGLPEIFRQKFVELQMLDQQAEGISVNVKEAKRRLFTEYPNLSKFEIEERSRSIKQDYKKMRDLYTTKFQLSSRLEQLMDRINNKVKKDTDEFRYELELENPGCTYEFEKKFNEEYDRAYYSGRAADSSARESQLACNGLNLKQGGQFSLSTNRSIVENKHEKHVSSQKRPDKSLRKLLIDTGGGNKFLHANDRAGRFLENGSSTSSFRPSPVSADYSPTPSTSRFSTPRHTPGPVSPAIRQAYHHGSINRQVYANGANLPQSAPANFSAPNFLSDSASANFDPTSTAMPSFASGHESRHGRPRKLTTRVKQMLNEQKGYRSAHQHSILTANVQGLSSVSGQGLNAMPTDQAARQSSLGLKGNGLRRQSTSSGVSKQRQRLKRSSLAMDDDDGASRNEEGIDDEFENESAEYDDYVEDMDDEDGDNQLWCLCHTKSYGNMVACDNPRCSIVWFHYECVGLTESPEEGQKWYCPVCRSLMPHSSRN